VLPELDTRRLAALRPGAIVMYPVPYDRGVESTEDVFIRRVAVRAAGCLGRLHLHGRPDFLFNGTS